VRCLDDKRVVSRSADSKLVVWDWTSEQIERELRVKGKSEGTRALFDVSSDGQYLAVGSKKGAVYLYELHTGECIHVLEHKRARQSVRACAFSAHCRHVLFATEALIWRWDHLDPKTLKDEDRARLALRGEPEPSAEAIISEDSADSKPEKLE
jgi:WD40 repeat protein